MVSGRRRVLIVANRTVATPMLVDAVRRRASAQPCSFALLVPYVGRREDSDWPLEWLVALLEEAGGTHVESLGQAGAPARGADRGCPPADSTKEFSQRGRGGHRSGRCAPRPGAPRDAFRADL